MLDILKSWNGQITINGVIYDSADSVSELPKTALHIVLGKKVVDSENKPKNALQNVSDVKQYIFTVKGYMCKKSTDDFDFMRKYNADIPMPMRTMVGTIEKETKGMIYINVRGKGLPTVTCMRCGRELKNPISRHYGIGPECIAKLGFSYGIEDEEQIKESLVDITWQGWCPKSAVLEQTEVTENE